MPSTGGWITKEQQFGQDLEEVAARLSKLDRDIPTFNRRNHWGIETPDPGTVYTFREGSRRFEPGIVPLRKKADQSVNNTTTLANDTHLLFTAGVNEVWLFTAGLLWTTGATPGIKWGWSYPSGATIRWSSPAASGGSATSGGGASHSHTVTIGTHTHAVEGTTDQASPTHSHKIFDYATGASWTDPAYNILLTAPGGSVFTQVRVGRDTDPGSGFLTSGNDNASHQHGSAALSGASGGGSTPTSSSESTHTHTVPAHSHALAALTETDTITLTGAATAFWISFFGIIVMSSTAGSLNLQFAQGTAEATNTTMLTNSWMRAERFA